MARKKPTRAQRELQVFTARVRKLRDSDPRAYRALHRMVRMIAEPKRSEASAA